MGLCDDVRRHCAEVAASARWVSIDAAAIEHVDPGPAPALDPERHYLEGTREDVATYLLTLDAINFGSGWFPTLRKRPGCSGYFTVAWALADRFRSEGPWSNEELRALDPTTVADTLDQDRDHELMALYATALNDLGGFLGERTTLDLVGDSAEQFATTLAHGMSFFDDRGFYKRAQIAANDLALAGIAQFTDLDRLTIFADNLVPHVLRVDGVLKYDPALAAHIDSEQLLEPGPQEQEIRACAVHACEQVAARLQMQPRDLDVALWNRGQDPRYKALPRHRTRTVFY